MKHGKKIVDQQLPLKRVAEVTMDLYAMAAVTSRATASLNAKLATAAHEKTLALGEFFSPAPSLVLECVCDAHFLSLP